MGLVSSKGWNYRKKKGWGDNEQRRSERVGRTRMEFRKKLAALRISLRSGWIKAMIVIAGVFIAHYVRLISSWWNSFTWGYYPFVIKTIYCILHLGFLWSGVGNIQWYSGSFYLVSFKSKQGLLGKIDHSESRELSQITHVQDNGKIQSSLVPREEAANKISKAIIKPMTHHLWGKGQAVTQ